MPFDLYVHCPNTECLTRERPIALLVANPEQTVDDPNAWPKDGSEKWIACPGCRHVSVHCRADLRDLPEDTHTKHKEWICVTLVCGAEGCKTQSRFHVLMRKLEEKKLTDELNLRIHSGHWIGTLPCGHPFSSASHVVFDRQGIPEKR